MIYKSKLARIRRKIKIKFSKSYSRFLLYQKQWIAQICLKIAFSFLWNTYYIVLVQLRNS